MRWTGRCLKAGAQEFLKEIISLSTGATDTCLLFKKGLKLTCARIPFLNTFMSDSLKLELYSTLHVPLYY